MNSILRYIVYLSLLSVSPPAAAMTIAGIELSDHTVIDDQSLVLNGAGIRSKFFVKVYVGALYLPESLSDSEDILSLTGPGRMQMNIIYRQVSADKIASGWTEGFRANLQAQDFARLETDLQHFNRLFPDLVAGDVVQMDRLVDGATRLSINGRVAGQVDNPAFFDALLRVWIGENPADSDLKKGLLGN